MGLFVSARWKGRASDAVTAMARRLRRPRLPQGPAVACAACESALMCPIDWRAEDAAHWCVAFRCGDCGERVEIELSNAQTSRLECELDSQLTVIRGAAERLDRERMEAQVAAFIAGLRDDHVIPADFGAA